MRIVEETIMDSFKIKPKIIDGNILLTTLSGCDVSIDKKGLKYMLALLLIDEAENE